MLYGYSSRLMQANKSASKQLLGVRLGRVCISKGVPVATVAQHLGVSRQTIYNWFTGITTPRGNFARTAEALLVELAQQ